MIKDFVADNQFMNFPSTRYMGSKNKIIHSLWEHLSNYQFDSFLDVFAGSNVVSYFMKCKGKEVTTNDFLSFSFIAAKATIENSHTQLSNEDVMFLMEENNNNGFIQATFDNIFFTPEENKFLDRTRFNIELIQDEYKRAIALSALVRSCVKKRSRGIFTFVGERYDDGREDMKKPLSEHFIESVGIYNKAVFNNHKDNRSFNLPSHEFTQTKDLVYLDPPYYSPKSDNDYVRRYHFVEGMVKGWDGLDIQHHTKVKKFKSYESPFSKKVTTYSAFEHLIQQYSDSIIAISYSSNSLPTKDELKALLLKYKSKVEIHEINHVYSFGNQNHKIGNVNNRVKEYLFIGE